MIAAETAWRMMTRRDPYVNMLRTAIAVTAAGFGGADAVTALPHTAPLGLPDALARRRCTQHSARPVGGIRISARVADPAAGSGAIEAITQQFCAAAWSSFQDIEKAGGVWAALETGLVQRNVAAVRSEREKAVARGKDILTGTNAYPDIHEGAAPAVLDVAPWPAANNDPAAVTTAALPRSRLAEPFELLRERSDRMLAKTGARPKVFLATLGTAAEFTTRAAFAKNFFEAGGIEAVGGEGDAFKSRRQRPPRWPACARRTRSMTKRRRRRRRRSRPQAPAHLSCRTAGRTGGRAAGRRRAVLYLRGLRCTSDTERRLRYSGVAGNGEPRSGQRMSRIPNFSQIDFADAPSPAPAQAAPWLTPEGITVKSAYGAGDLDGLDGLEAYPGIAPYPARPLPDHVCHPAVDDPAICRLLHGGRFQRLLPAQSRRRPEGPFDRLRSRHPSRLRQRSSARLRRRRHGGRRHRLDLRHAHAVRRHPARSDVGVDDHERRRAAGAGALYRRRRGARRAAGETRRHHPERHPQRVHGAQHLYLSAKAVAAHHLRYFLLHVGAYAEIQFDLDFRLSHAGGRSDRRSRARLYACRRRRICPRRAGGEPRGRSFRAKTVVLLRHRHEFFHGGGEAARGARAVGEADEAIRSEGRALAVAAHPLPDLGLVAHRAGRVQQRHPHRHRGHGGDAGRHAIAAHQCARRGAGVADRFFRPHRAQHPDRAAAGKRHDARDRSVGRLVLCRAAHPRSRHQDLGPYRRGRGNRRHDARHRGRACRSCASRKPPRARRRASIPARRR